MSDVVQKRKKPRRPAGKWTSWGSQHKKAGAASYGGTAKGLLRENGPDLGIQRRRRQAIRHTLIDVEMMGAIEDDLRKATAAPQRVRV
jgi:hypothetical protein